ncbi:MAG TPA: hypothetical protein VNR40_04700, partial [Steroidobacter sp.]|nr:hypothetical protein [Steroidobacter sp.]
SNHDGTILARETVPSPTPTLDELARQITTVANLGHSDYQQIRSTLNSESAKAQQGVRMVNDGLQSCGEAENGGVRMPERPAAFLERNGRLGGACEFFSGNN